MRTALITADLARITKAGTDGDTQGLADTSLAVATHASARCIGYWLAHGFGSGDIAFHLMVACSPSSKVTNASP